MAMADADWDLCVKPYADAILMDQIKSQRIANALIDWVWGSGKYHPEHTVQHIVNIAFNQHLAEDGSLGPASIASINSVDEPTLYADIMAARYEYLKECVTAKPTNSRFYNGWVNRMNDLEEFNKPFA